MATKTVSNMVEAPRRSPLLFLAAVAAIGLVVAGAFYLGLQKTAIIDEQARLDEEIATLNTEISALESEKIEAAQLAQEWLDSIEAEEIFWSRVINRIQALVPFDTITSQPKIRFLSYSGSQGGRISLNAQSRAAQLEPFADVAELISVFNASSFFSNAYVPTITRGETESGDKILSFLFNMNYKEEEPETLVTPVARTQPAVTPAVPAAVPETTTTPETTTSTSETTTVPETTTTSETTTTPSEGVSRQ